MRSSTYFYTFFIRRRRRRYRASGAGVSNPIVGLQRHGNVLYLHHPSGKLCRAAMRGDLTQVKSILVQGAPLNVANKSGENCLQFYIKHCKEEDFQPEVAVLLFASGEVMENCDPSCSEVLPDAIKAALDKLNLKALCFRSIRHHLLRLDRHGNLFERVPRLPLPVLLKNEMLMNTSLATDTDESVV